MVGKHALHPGGGEKTRRGLLSVAGGKKWESGRGEAFLEQSHILKERGLECGRLREGGATN